MATTKAAETKTVSYNAKVSVSKQTLNDEEGREVRALYYLAVVTEKGNMKINVGQKTYEEIKKISE